MPPPPPPSPGGGGGPLGPRPMMLVCLEPVKHVCHHLHLWSEGQELMVLVPHTTILGV